MTLPVSISPKPMIELAHHRIHEGNHFLVHQVSLGVNIAFPKYYLIIPPPSAGTDTTEMHLIFEVVSQIGGTLILFEDATISANGTALTIINNNRRSSSTSQVNVYEDPTVTTEGTTIFSERKGTASTEVELGEFFRDDEEIILHPDKQYLLKFTPLADGANITMELNWYDNRPSSPIP